MFNFTTVVFDGTSPTFISQTLRDGTPQVQIHSILSEKEFGFRKFYQWTQPYTALQWKSYLLLTITLIIGT